MSSKLNTLRQRLSGSNSAEAVFLCKFIDNQIKAEELTEDQIYEQCVLHMASKLNTHYELRVMTLNKRIADSMHELHGLGCHTNLGDVAEHALMLKIDCLRAKNPKPGSIEESVVMHTEFEHKLLTCGYMNIQDVVAQHFSKEKDHGRG